MAFFDELGRKLSQTGQGAVQKVKDTSEIMRLNSLISDEEKKINTLTVQLGQKYFELHADSIEPAFQQAVEGIKESRTKIANYTEQIKTLKGVVRCPNCGAEVANNSRFCNSCGSPMPDVTPLPSAAPQTSAETGGKVCPECGAVMSSDKLFCTNCGCKFQSEKTKETSEELSEHSEGTAEISSRADSLSGNTEECLCPFCGKHLSPNAVFCSGCGNQVRGA